MSKTLLVMTTHLINEGIIAEFQKMKNTPNVEAVLAINNEEYKTDFKNRVENRIFFGTSVKCFFFDADLHDELNLPHFVDSRENFGGLMWNYGDCRFYYVRKIFPDYKFYWFVEYDVICNAPTYESFLQKFEGNQADFLVTNFRKESYKTGWCWLAYTEWIYTEEQFYGSFFPVERISAAAIDFLYNRRLEHEKIFQASTVEPRSRIFCELFAPTELMAAGFSCENIDEPNISGDKKTHTDFYLNDNRFFCKPDGHLYHPVKSTITQLESLRRRTRKILLTNFVERLAEIFPALKNFQVQFDNKNYNAVSFNVSTTIHRGGDFRYSAKFVSEKNLQLELIFSGKFNSDESFQLVSSCEGLEKILPLYTQQTAESRVIFYSVENFESVNFAANVMKILIESTLPTLREKFFSE